MNDPKENFNTESLLEDNDVLPDKVNILKFAAARSREITTMTECILNPYRKKLVFQSLPVHMRRRIMSHNCRRLPRRLRAAHAAQKTKSSGVESPIRSRKQRRRPRRLLADYARRQKEHRWLETHIWHAKRFHMTKKWGYNLPEAPCDKAFRACYRAGSAHCLLQDISYLCPIQISGSLEELKSGFKRITNQKCGLSITANAFLKGEREGQSFVFNVDKYPLECIGKISFIWRSNNDAQDKCVWIFVHPSFYNEFLDVLIQCFQLNKVVQIPEKEIINSNTKERKKKNKKKEDKECISTLLDSEFHNFYENKTTIKLIEFKDTLNRYRLTGPLSHAVLTEALRTIKTENKLNGWFETYISDENNLATHNVQTSFWNKMKNIKSPAEIQSHLIINLNVDDPRIHLPKKRMKALPNVLNGISVDDLINIPPGLCFSPLWDLNIRKIIYKQFSPNYILNKLREKFTLVPGESSSIFSDIPGVPILLIQRPGSKSSDYKKIGYNSGWDIIVPSKYGMAFWLSFILRGARTGGVRETTRLAFECGNFDSYPDTAISLKENAEKEALLRDKYFRLPPNKRVNFNKLSINSPFMCQWQILLRNWNHNNQKPFYVLRDKSTLDRLQDMIVTGKRITDIDWNENCLVPVKILIEGKGKLTDFALICLPKEKDQISNPSSQLIEPLRKDRNEKERCELRSAHKILLKRLRRKSIQRKRKILEKAKKYVEVPKQDNTKMIKDYLSTMRELWLPTVIENVRHQCSHEVIGYITKGDFSFTEAQCSGMGYIALPSLVHVIKKRLNRKCLVLVRNTLSRQYRFGSIEIVCDILRS